MAHKICRCGTDLTALEEAYLSDWMHYRHDRMTEFGTKYEGPEFLRPMCFEDNLPDATDMAVSSMNALLGGRAWQQF